MSDDTNHQSHSSIGPNDCTGNKSLFQKFFEVAEILFVALDQYGKISLINPKGCELLGYSKDDLVGRDWFKTCLPEDARTKVRNVFDQLMTGEYKPIEYFENPVLTSDGNEKLIAWHNTLIYGDTTKNVLGTISAGIDITEKKLAEEALLRSEDKYRALSEATFEGVAIHEDGFIIDLNLAFASMFGYNLSELMGKSVLDLAASQSRNLIKNAIQSRKEEPYEALGLRKDGTTFHGELRSRNVKYRKKVVRVTAVRDISERKQAEQHRIRLEQQIQRSQKLESLGIMAGGIAHDFNNLLTGILGNTDLARLECSPTSPMQHHLSQIKNAAVQLSKLTQQMLDYAGRGKSSYETLNLSELIQNTIQLLQASVPKKTKLELDLAPELPPVQADPNQIRQVIVNLVTNAAESIGKQEGNITLRTGVLEVDQAFLENTISHEGLREGVYASLEVSDTGCGISSEDRNKVFDPFFTTKFTGRGLGLATALGIVRGHHGTISLDTRPDFGSTFRLLLPVAKQAARNVMRCKTPANGFSQKSKAILVVDDEEAVRRVVKTMLERSGYRVWIAADGMEAIQIVQNRLDEIGAVLLDLTMPKLDGLETYQKIRRIKKELPVILSSGYSQMDAMTQFNCEGLAGFIQKPYDHVTLLEKMRQWLKNTN